jgi:hypothetical protein
MKTNEPDKKGAEPAAKAPGPAQKQSVQRAEAGASLPPLALDGLQSAAGNGAVVALLGVQRAPATPTSDPRFLKVTGTVRRVAQSERKHVPAGKAAGEASKAAAPPANDKAAKAAASQVSTMAEQKPGEFDKAAFIAAVRKAIEAKSPKNLEEADDFSQSGKAGEVKAEVGGMVSGGKNAAAGAITSATTAPPNEGKVASKDVVPMRKEVAGPAPAPVGGAAAMPTPLPAAATDLSAGPAEVSAKMASAQVTDEQLAASNEPQFAEAAQSKQALEAHAAAAPAAARADEKAILDKSRTEAGAASRKGVGAMRAKRAGSMNAVNRRKEAAKAKDEARQAEFATKLKATYETTRTEVTAILDGLDAKVGTAFDAGEAEARQGFEKQVADEMKAFRDERYDGIGGAARWAWDKLTSPPPEVNQIFERARAAYLERMNGVIASVADLVGAELGKAKARIARGKAEVSKLVAELPKHLRKNGAAAAEKVQADFDSLSSDVESKQEGLVQDLAQRYTAAAGAVDARVEELKSENKGLLDKAKDAVVGAVQTILKLKDMLLGVLARAASAIGAIIAKPIEFLGNLIAAVKGGLDAFVANIDTHLQNGLLGWLTGSLGAAGVTMPDKLDLRGIVGLVLQILGLTWANIRGRIARAIGEPAMAAIEQGVEVVKTLITEGPAGLWKWVVEKLNNLEEMVIGAIKDFVKSRVITAGITWLISLLNPAAAFIKACKAIYDIIMFFVERGSQIMEFVNSILDSIGSIASGAVGGAISYIEQTLAKALPVAISFLASLLGLDGIGEKVRGIIAKVQAPINKVIDGIVGGVVKAGKKLISRLRPKKRDKDKADSGDVRARARKALLERFGSKTHPAAARAAATAVLGELTPHGLKRLNVVDAGEGRFRVMAEASPYEELLALQPPNRTAMLTAKLTFADASGAAGFTEVKARRARKDASGRPIADGQGGFIMDPMAQHFDPVQVERTTPRIKGYRGKQNPDGRVVSGGAVAPPQSESNELHAAAWNTGDRDELYSSNVSHAERQLTAWLKGHKLEKREGISGIDLEINLSPCGKCIDSLLEIADLTPNCTKATRKLKWSDPFDGKDATTTADLERLAVHWTVTPASVPDEPVIVPATSK